MSDAVLSPRPLDRAHHAMLRTYNLKAADAAYPWYTVDKATYLKIPPEDVHFLAFETGDLEDKYKTVTRRVTTFNAKMNRDEARVLVRLRSQLLAAGVDAGRMEPLPAWIHEQRQEMETEDVDEGGSAGAPAGGSQTPRTTLPQSSPQVSPDAQWGDVC